MAAKEITFSVMSMDVIVDFLRETYLAQDLTHKNIVHFYGVDIRKQQAKPQLYLVFEFCPTSLDKILFDRNLLEQEQLPFKKRQKWTLDVACGMRFLHEKHIVHRDLKTQNILLGIENDQMVAKVGDFGMSRYLPRQKFTRTKIDDVLSDHEGSMDSEEIREAMEQSQGITLEAPPSRPQTPMHRRAHTPVGCVEDDVLDGMTTTVGTIEYTAPEILSHTDISCEFSIPQTDKKAVYGPSADSFSFGSIMWELATATRLYDDHARFATLQSVKEFVISGQRLTIPPITINPYTKEIPDKYRRLLYMCWHNSPNRRPSFETIVYKLERMKSKKKRKIVPKPLFH